MTSGVFPITAMTDLEGEVDCGVEGLLDLYLRLAVPHAVVAHVKLSVPRVSELHVGLKHCHYYRVITQNIHISMNCISSQPHKSV